MSHHRKSELDQILREVREIRREVEEIERQLQSKRHPTSITFQEITMNPTAAGQTQVFTGTLAPVGSQFPVDTVATVTSNDSTVSPALDSTNLVVSVTYPAGWVENASTPLAFAYNASSASNPTWSLSATITPSAPAAILPTSITFTQTT